jgi:hypothetical protein
MEKIVRGSYTYDSQKDSVSYQGQDLCVSVSNKVVVETLFRARADTGYYEDCIAVHLEKIEGGSVVGSLSATYNKYIAAVDTKDFCSYAMREFAYALISQGCFMSAEEEEALRSVIVYAAFYMMRR